jgi:hypothetical protein
MLPVELDVESVPELVVGDEVLDSIVVAAVLA